MTGRIVDFFVIGAQKCATSWLYYCLREHPQIEIHRKKDEENYIGGARHAENESGWFDTLYDLKPGSRVRGAVSVNYLHDWVALEYCLRQYPNAKFIACLRNPLERSASAYAYLIRRGLLPNRELSDGMRTVLAAHRDPLQSRTQEAEIIERSLYARQLRPIVDAEGLERLLMLGYEQLCADPGAMLRAVYDFLGVDAGHMPPSFSLRPKRSANIPLLTRLERLAPRSLFLSKLMDYANQWLCRLGLGRKTPLYAADVEEALRQVFAADVADLESVIARMQPGRVLLGGKPSAIWSFNASRK